MRLLGALLACWLMPAPAADGAEPYSPGYDELVAQAPAPPIDAEITPAAAFVEASVRRPCPNDGHCRTPCDACGQARYTGWYVGSEITIHEPRFTSAGLTFDGDAMVGGRFVIGHEGAGGGGIRGRFWGAGNDELAVTDVVAPFGAATIDFDMNLLEVDFYKRLWFGDTNIAFGAGTRHGAIGMAVGGVDSNTPGSGLGAFIEASRIVHSSDRWQFAWLGYGRFSVLSDDVRLAGTPVDVDSTLTITELGLGCELRRRMGRGDLVAAFIFEQQSWDSNLMPEITLGGQLVRIGYHW